MNLDEVANQAIIVSSASDTLVFYLKAGRYQGFRRMPAERNAEEWIAGVTDALRLVGVDVTRV